VTTPAVREPGIDFGDPGLPRALPLAFDALREQDPVHALREGAWLLTRHDDVAAVLKDRVRCATDIHAIRGYDETRPFGAGTALERIQEGLLINLPADEHRRQRSAQSGRYVRHNVEAAMTELVQRLAGELLDALPADGSQVDLVPALTRTLPIRLFMELFALPAADVERLLDWTHYDTVTFDVLLSPALVSPAELRRGQDAMFELRDYLDALARERMAEPGDDLMSFLLDAHARGLLSYEEVLTQAGEALAAGTTTTQTLLAGMLEAFALHPAQWDALRANPQLVGAAVEEALRHVSPVLSIGRVAMTAFELRGRQIRAGDVLQPLVLAATRDPAVFPDPHAFDIGRSPNPMLSFGGGSHVCLGQHIARLEARVVLAAMIERYARIELDAPGTMHPTLVVRTYVDLPARLVAA
jgi:cytochrome P450